MQNRLVFFLIVIAVIMAIAGFLLVSFLTRGPELPPGAPEGEAPAGELPPAGTPVDVDGTTVYLNVDPVREVQLRSQEAPAPAVPEVTDTPLPQPSPTTALQATAAPTTAAPAQSGPVTGTDPIVFIDYVVQPEDTLYRITQKQNTSIELMAVHGIDARDLVTGATLRLPVANPNYCVGARPYLVRPNDTVFSIARRFNTTKEVIVQLNGLGADYRINIAQVLCVP